MLPILILAAGQSRRMRGADKLLQDVDGVPLLQRQCAIALAVSDDVRVALPPAPHPRYDVVAGLPVDVVPVPDAAEGMGVSLRRVFATLSPGTPYAMLLLADLPDLTVPDLHAVKQAVQTHPDALIWRGATPDGRGGHPMIFAASLFPDIAKLDGDDGGKSVVRAAGTRVHHVCFDDNRARHDLDTPEDWAAWHAARADRLT
ncbi:nucleotidyltransferase family protein [uncultured Tateyamaria sp.]|uniref:nucleotidyltransferase family protein n=1 Tax=uncultured Tateyamaria sp. TaxID=455651 RepID=UPI002632C6F5|nr:nucleotidyltransferase family protein [uncultured Tateyamaria sp.]